MHSGGDGGDDDEESDKNVDEGDGKKDGKMWLK